MAIKELKREWSPSQLAYVKEFLLHTEAELQEVPRCSVGSKAIVSETDNEYVKTTDGWMLLCDCDEDGGQGAGGGGGMPEGGAPNQMLVTGADGSTKWEDRTHWEENGLDALAEFTVANGTYDDTNGEYVFTVSDQPFDFDAYGEKLFEIGCTVIVDGITYINVLAYAAGPVNKVIGEISDECPFAILIKGSTEIIGFSTTLPGETHDVKIGIPNVTIHPLDPKYLPEDHINGMIDSKLEGAGGGGGGVHVVFDFPNGFNSAGTANKTYSEITAAISSGEPVTAIARVNSAVYGMQFNYTTAGYSLMFKGQPFAASSAQGNLYVSGIGDKVYAVLINYNNNVTCTTLPVTE